MTEKELRRMSRSDLLEMLISQMEENESLRVRLQKAEKELENRRINLSKAGSIAEAALLLNGVFQAADKAAAQYLENIREYSSRLEESGNEPEEEAGQMIYEEQAFQNEVYEKDETV